MAGGKMRIFSWGVGLAVLAAAGAGIYGVYGSSGSQAGGFTLEVAAVERGDVALLVSAAGSVRALTTVEVGSQLSGQVLELNADFNTQVEAGQVIARIDPQTFETRVASAEADVVAAEANVAVQQASIVRAQANLGQVERDFSRQSALYRADAIAQSVFEEAQRQLDVALADVAVAEAQLLSAQANLVQRRASLRSAEVDLERTIIRSPITGVVIERNVDVGQTVAASLSAPVLFQIAQDLGDIRIDAAVVEADIGGVNAGDVATFTVDAYPDQTFDGVVEQVRLAAQETANVVTYTVVIAADNPRGRLLPGMTANVEITADKRENVLRLPETVVRFRPPSRGGPEVVMTDGGGAPGGASARGGRGGPGGGGGGPGGGFGQARDRMLTEIGVEEARRERISGLIGEAVAGVRADFGDAGQTFDRARMRTRMMAAVEQVMRAELSGEEFRAYSEAMARMASRRTAQVYQRGEGGTLVQKTLVIGLSDMSYVEVLRGGDEGDEFVTRLRAVEGGS